MLLTFFMGDDTIHLDKHLNVGGEEDGISRDL